MRTVRVVVEMAVSAGITDRAAVRAINDFVMDVTPQELRRHGILPSSLKCKSYQRVVAAEYGVHPNEADSDTLEQ